MTLITFAQVITVCLLGAMSPGPSMAVVINNAIIKGRYHGILTSIGHGIGITIYATLAVLGLGLIIKTNIYIFNIPAFVLFGLMLTTAVGEETTAAAAETTAAAGRYIFTNSLSLY